jgi:DNA-binding transcriptional regulator YiaG
MSNLGSILKQEIARIARREVRAQTGAMKKASAQHRRSIAMLRRRIDGLEKKLSVASLRSTARAVVDPAEADGSSRIRFVAKGVRSLRGRLGLSAGSFGRLLGVSAQSVYNWERQITTPRNGQLKSLAAIRGIGKREAAARLQALEAAPVNGKTPARGRGE